MVLLLTTKERIGTEIGWQLQKKELKLIWIWDSHGELDNAKIWIKNWPGGYVEINKNKRYKKDKTKNMILWSFKGM